MRLGVVQMFPEGSRDRDLAALTGLLGDACALGASVVVLPHVSSLDDDTEARAVLATRARCPQGVTVLSAPDCPPGVRPEPEQTPLGLTLSLTGDDCIDPAVQPYIRSISPDALVLRPEAESAIQAEAILELAIGYSTSLSGLVIVCSTAAEDPGGEPHGGTSVIERGEVIAETVDPDEAIVADVEPPVGLQQPPSQTPEPQLILRQRLARHHGRRAEVDWLADLD